MNRWEKKCECSSCQLWASIYLLSETLFSVFKNFFILIFGVIYLFLTAISNSRILLYLLKLYNFSLTGSNYLELSFKFFPSLSDCLKRMASLCLCGTVLNYPRMFPSFVTIASSFAWPSFWAIFLEWSILLSVFFVQCCCFC